MRKLCITKRTNTRYGNELFAMQEKVLTTLKKMAFKNIAGKGENAGNQHFLLFPLCFILIFRIKSIIPARFNVLSINGYIPGMSSKILFSGKGIDRKCLSSIVHLVRCVHFRNVFFYKCISSLSSAEYFFLSSHSRPLRENQSAVSTMIRHQ